MLFRSTLGLALVMGVRVGLKAALAALFGDAPFTDGLRYLCIALTGGILWPMTFGFWSRLGKAGRAGAKG